jgi:hypothetical protein
MSKIINIQEYKDNEFEKMFFLYYKHVEDFFEEKADETSVMTRLYFGIRYVEGLSNVFAKYKKEGKPSEKFITFAKEQADMLKKIAEVLDV